MKKIFIVTGEPSGDKIAASVISQLKKIFPDIEYLSVGGSHLQSLDIKSIFDLKDITYLGFTSVIFNIFKIRKKINMTVEEIIRFKPDILFTIDSPDFTLRVSERVKKINKNIKTIHYVAPQVWVWRKNRVKKMKKFIDHILLLFYFEKIFFDEEGISNTFVGHPLLQNENIRGTDLNNLISKNKKIISLFPGSRHSETKVLLPILIDFIKLMNAKSSDYSFVFHATHNNKNFIINKVKYHNIDNIEIISDENIKLQTLIKSTFAVAKSGTISLQICNANIPSIIIYKLNFINFMIFKFLVNVRFANIINIINDKEVIPELLQNECNANEIYKSVTYLLKKPELINEQLSTCKKTIDNIKSKTSSAEESALVLTKFLIS